MRDFLKRHGRLAALGAAGIVLAATVGGLAMAQAGIGPFAPAPVEVAQSEFVARLEAGRVAEVSVAGSRVEFVGPDGEKGRTAVLWTEELRAAVAAPGVALTVEDRVRSFGGANDLLDLILKLNMVGFLALAAVLLVRFMRTPVPGMARAKSEIRFADVAGIDEVRAEVAELIDYLREPARYRALGVAVPKGVLLVGPPGTGKTLLARAVAGEAGVPFFAVAGSDFVEMYVGLGAARLRRLFRDARKKAPCILFIDEIDALARARGAASPSGGQIETENTLNQLLAEMDGFARAEGLIVMAATNRVEVLDPAVLRPGRFDRHVHVGLPDLKGRRDILAVHAAGLRLDDRVDLGVVARGTSGMSGAELANLVNEAGLVAARAGRPMVEADDFERARDRIVMGGERVMVMSQEQRRLTAYHEAGHALVALRSRHSDPVHKVTIVPHGRALGMMVRLPEEDRFCHSRARLLAELDVAMGGRAAEELIFGADMVTTGAAGDIRMATDVALRMVTVYGMSARFGLVALGDGAPGGLAAPLAAPIAGEVRALTEAAHARARAVLAGEIGVLHALAAALLEHETLDADAVRRIVDGAYAAPAHLPPACAAAE
ncbi:ATP-dependent zinc metalloprotease FtsH [Arenibaculum sp.]|jgi:cell division protease FtsH|uniref:ATP-dependent zinc metalloprotease FtsH n=1 Tax=Arenibaculum sp. TaxID=2865862 RepID=UPI002E0E13C1|nr:ATP-dependent zinc metalloprotease FtsH [Arenibaculum sp.]